MKTIQKKVKKVTFPPVDMPQTHKITEKEKDLFMLRYQGWCQHKKSRLIVRAFNRMPEKRLIVIGGTVNFIRKLN